MSEFHDRYTVSRLVGAPPGYVGYDEGGQLTEKVRRRPFSVVLFDEIEKAHPDVFNTLLQILEDGRLTDGQGRIVDFKNTVIILTTNLGTRDVAKAVSLGFQASEDSESNYERMKQKVNDELKQHFRPEFLNRIDDTIVFHQLREDGDPADRGHHDPADRGPAAQQGHGPGADRQRQEVPGEEGLRPGAGRPAAASHDPARHRGQPLRADPVQRAEPGPDRGGRLRGRPGRHREVQAGLPGRGQAGRGAGRRAGRPRRHRRRGSGRRSDTASSTADRARSATATGPGRRPAPLDPPLWRRRGGRGRRAGAWRQSAVAVAGAAGQSDSSPTGSTRPSVDQPGQRPGAAATSSAQTWSSRCRGTGPVGAPAARPAAARVPAGRCRRTAGAGGSARRARSGRRRARRRPTRAGSRAQRGDAGGADQRAELHERGAGQRRRGRLGRQQLARWRPGRPGGWPGRRPAPRRPPGQTTRRTLVSTTGCRCPYAKAATARAVYVPTPGRASSWSRSVGHLAAVPLHDRHRALAQPQRPARVAEPAPHPDRLGRACRRPGRPASGQRASQASQAGSTRTTGVCWSMTSLTRIGPGADAGLAPRQVAGVLLVPPADQGGEGGLRHRAADDATRPPPSRPGVAAGTVAGASDRRSAGRIGQNARMNELAITVIGRDRPGHRGRRRRGARPARREPHRLHHDPAARPLRDDPDLRRARPPPRSRPRWRRSPPTASCWPPYGRSPPDGEHRRRPVSRT